MARDSDTSNERRELRGRPPDPPGPVWHPATRVAFRFSFIYLGLFVVATQVAGSLFLLPGLEFRGLGGLWPLQQVTLWLGSHFWGVSGSPDPAGLNGEDLFFWVQTVWIFGLAVLATLVWSGLDRQRLQYQTLHKWFRMFIRLALASQMIEYGMTKIIPNQFAAPGLDILSSRVGDLPLNTLFWTSVGAAPAYQMFTGWAELLGGVLLLVGPLTMVGALLCLADMSQVLTLNLSYDIGLKITSLHLVFLAVFLLVPDAKRLYSFALGRATRASRECGLFADRRANRVAAAAQVALGLYLITVQGLLNVAYWNALGGGAARSALYGVWDVEALSIDGESRPVSLNDYDRQWRRVIFDRPDTVTFQRTDDSMAHYGVAIDPASRHLALTKGASREWEAGFSFEEPSEGELILEGKMDGYTIRLDLRRVEFDTFRLLNSDFRWLRPVSE